MVCSLAPNLLEYTTPATRRLLRGPWPLRPPLGQEGAAPRYLLRGAMPYSKENHAGRRARDRRKRKKEATLKRKRRGELVAYKGGKCERCGYSAYIGALDFHHRDPEDKSFELQMNQCRKPWEVLVKEADKCLLLCKNCHAEEHALIRAGVNDDFER